MDQPHGFVDPRCPQHICKLYISIYGLKQATRTWFSKLFTFLISTNFSSSKTYTSLFYFSKTIKISFILVYVDDLLLIGPNQHFIDSIIWLLHINFSIRNFDQATFFLNIEFVPNFDGFVISISLSCQIIISRPDRSMQATPLCGPPLLTTLTKISLLTIQPHIDISSVHFNISPLPGYTFVCCQQSLSEDTLPNGYRLGQSQTSSPLPQRYHCAWSPAPSTFFQSITRL